MKTKLLFLTLLLLAFGGSLCAQKSPSNPVGANITVADSGSCSTVNSFLWQQLPNNAGTTTVNLAGTFVATVTIRESNNGGGSWTTATTLSAAGTTTFATNGFTDICADVTAYTSGTVQVSLSTGLQQVQSVISGGSGSSSASPAVQAITVSENCLVATITCFPVKNTGRYVWDATIPNSSSTWTTQASDPPFVAADVGYYIFATNGNVPGYFFQFTSQLVTPSNCAITAVNSAHSVTVNCTSIGTSNTLCAATAQAGCFMAWGPKETTFLGNAWTANVAACSTMTLPGINAYGTGPSVFFVDAASFNTVSTGLGQSGNNATCSEGNEAMLRGIGLQGKDISSTVILATPDFNFNSCTFGHSAKACFFTTYTALNLRDLTLFGGAVANPAGVNAGQVVTEWGSMAAENGGTSGGTSVNNVAFLGWGAGSSGIPTCIQDWAGGLPERIRIKEDGCGQVGLRTGGATGLPTQVAYHETTLYDNWQGNWLISTATTVKPAVVDSFHLIAGTIGTATASCNVSVQSSGAGANAILLFNSHGDTIGQGQTGVQIVQQGAICLNQGILGATGGTVIVNAHGMLADHGTGQTNSGEAVWLSSNGIVEFHSFGGYYRNQGSAANVAVLNQAAAGGGFYDEEKSTLVGTTASLSGTGPIIGDASITGTAITAAKLVLSAGWGTTAAWTALTGNTKRVQGTITASGTGQLASPTITYTFPTPFWGTSNLICTASTLGGTQAAVATPFTPSALTATGVTFTYNATPGAGNTVVVLIDCGVK